MKKNEIHKKRLGMVFGSQFPNAVLENQGFVRAAGFAEFNLKAQLDKTRSGCALSWY